MNYVTYLQQLVVEIYDSGCGIEKKTVKQLYKLFKQSQDQELISQMSKFMGFCIIKKILKSYNGQFFINSKPNGKKTGTHIIFTFDLELIQPGDD